MASLSEALGDGDNVREDSFLARVSEIAYEWVKDWANHWISLSLEWVIQGVGLCKWVDFARRCSHRLIDHWWFWILLLIMRFTSFWSFQSWIVPIHESRTHAWCLFFLHCHSAVSLELIIIFLDAPAQISPHLIHNIGLNNASLGCKCLGVADVMEASNRFEL